VATGEMMAKLASLSERAITAIIRFEAIAKSSLNKADRRKCFTASGFRIFLI
jgi:hypothetical protein